MVSRGEGNQHQIDGEYNAGKAESTKIPHQWTNSSSMMRHNLEDLDLRVAPNRFDVARVCLAYETPYPLAQDSGRTSFTTF